MQKSLSHFVALSLCVSGIALADSDNAKQGQTQSPGSAGSVRTEVKVRDLNRHPDRFAGQQVMVTGKVDHIESANSFILDGAGLLNDKILVVVTAPQTGATPEQQGATQGPVIKEKEKLQLTGRIEEVGVTQIEEKYGPMKSEIKAEFEGNMPVLIVSPAGIKKKS